MKKTIINRLKPIVEQFPKLALTYRTLRDNAHIYEDPKDTPLGFKLNGNKSMENGDFEPEETKIVTNLLSKVDIVINVGANIGYYCCLALSHKKYVVAFEPLNMNLKYLLRNIKANGWESKIEIFPIALSDKVGVIEIYGGGTGASLLKGWAGTPDNYVTLVPCSTLNNVLGARFQGEKTLMIIDIEGAEQLMLDGASFAIDMDPKPIWLIEISVSEHQPKGIKINPNLLSTFQLFWDRDYESWTADEKFREIKSDEIEKIIKSEEDTLHTHNFLFFEKGKRNEFLGRIKDDGFLTLAAVQGVRERQEWY